MEAIDIFILVFLAIGAYSGYKQGLFISILSIVAFIIALILAFHLMDWGAQHLAEHVTELTFVLPFIAFIMIFLGVILIIRGLAYLVKKTLDFTILGSVDNIAGGVLGVLKTAFILSFFLWIADSLEFKITNEWIADSKSYPLIQPLAPVVISFLDDYTPIISEAVQSIQALVNLSADGIAD
ncbi:CvpA family protein [Cecembia sp.]|uniref:CvpA family protein n=1 Tax=Cecembia sp. TaxID=1898110 RepID=UPI0025C077B0|nr:CvpA family protein [Cecembia sp.]